MGIIDDVNLTVLPRLSPRITYAFRIRKILLIFLSILFIFNLIYLIFNVHAYIDNSWFRHYFNNNYELLWTLSAVIYDAFGLFVTYRYSRKGLRVFAWIGTIFLTLVCLVSGIILIGAFYMTRSANVIHFDVIGSFIFMSIFIVSAILLVIVIILSFRLSKAINNNTGETMNQLI